MAAMERPAAPHIEAGKRYKVQTDWASTSVRSLLYDADAKTLDIEYPSGEMYRYRGVPAAEFVALFSAESLGIHVNRRIKTRYAFEKL